MMCIISLMYVSFLLCNYYAVLGDNNDVELQAHRKVDDTVTRLSPVMVSYLEHHVDQSLAKCGRLMFSLLYEHIFSCCASALYFTNDYVI